MFNNSNHDYLGPNTYIRSIFNRVNIEAQKLIFIYFLIYFKRLIKTCY